MQRFLEASETRSRFGRAMGDVGEMRVRFDAPRLRLFEIASLACFLVHRLGVRFGNGRQIGIEMNERFLGFADEPGFAREIGFELLQARIEFASPIGRTLRLALQVFLLDFESRQRRSFFGFGFAKRRQPFRQTKFLVEGFRFRFRRGSETRHCVRELRLVLVDTRLRILPGQMHRQRFLLADFARDFLITASLPRLPLQRIRLRLQLPDDIAQAFDIRLSRPESQFRFMPARMQTGDACCIFKDAPPMLWLGVDEFADLSLPHECGRARARRRVLEQNLDVARPDFAAVDPVSGPRLALDAARDFNRIVVVEFGGRPSRAVVEEHRDFGALTLRASSGARKNHVVHRCGAHGFM